MQDTVGSISIWAVTHFFVILPLYTMTMDLKLSDPNMNAALIQGLSRYLFSCHEYQLLKDFIN